MSETAKHRLLAWPYCQGNGVDLGSGCDPVVPWAIQVERCDGPYGDLKFDLAHRAQYLGDATDLPFRDATMDFVHASHLIEDFADWQPVVWEWDRVLKPGGYMIIAVPDHERFRAYVQRGAEAGVDLDNLAHKHESRLGELPEYFPRYQTIFHDFVNVDLLEHSILYIGRKP